MKNNFVLLTILIIGLISLVSAFESQQYNFTTSVSQNGIDVNITNPIGVNVTNNSGNSSDGSTTDGGTTAGGSGGGGGGSLLSSVIKSVFNDEKNKTESSNSNEEENPEEKTTSTNFLTGAVIGISDFAKTPAGVATFIIVGLFVVGGVTFLAIKGKFKNFLPKKKESSIAEQ